MLQFHYDEVQSELGHYGGCFDGGVSNCAILFVDLNGLLALFPGPRLMPWTVRR